jgi:hypothetical protein
MTEIGTPRSLGISLILGAKMSMLKRCKAKDSSSLFLEKIAEEGWLSSQDAAKLLSVTPNAVRIMVCRGILPAFRLRGRLRFRKKDCAALFYRKGA